jgi:hypothetical protein
MLEERWVPAIANLGFIAPTTNGLVLLIPFPGANSSAGGSLGASGPGGGTAASVSGAPIPGGFFITGVGGISSMAPGNLTGVPSFLGGTNAQGNSAGSIQVGSGADSADAFTGGSSTTALVSRNVVADPFTRPLFTTIGGASTGSSAVDVLPPGQSYRDTAPVPAAAPLTTIYASSPTSTTPSSSGTFITNPYAPTTQVGSPGMGPAPVSSLTTSPLGGARIQGPATMPGINMN